jgi:hypothetical protein
MVVVIQVIIVFVKYININDDCDVE